MDEVEHVSYPQIALGGAVVGDPMSLREFSRSGRLRNALISVVIPCYQEDEVLARTHARIDKMTRSTEGLRWEIVYVDDGSRDGTWPIIRDLARRDPRVRGVRFSRNFGHQAACLAGLRLAAGDAVVLIDADLQDPPELIPEMVSRWAEGWAIVSGRRSGRRGETVFKRATASVYYRVLSLLADHPVTRDTGDFRLFDASVVAVLNRTEERELLLRAFVTWTGFAETSVEYQRDARAAGASKYGLRKMVALSRQGIVSSSAMPLRAATALGLLSLTGAAAAALTGRSRVAGDLTLFGLQATISGILGEYVNAAFRQTQRRPLYVVAEQLDGGFTALSARTPASTSAETTASARVAQLSRTSRDPLPDLPGIERGL